MAETCQLAVRRLEWLMSGGNAEKSEAADSNPYCSVDPAPPAQRKSVPELRMQLLDESLPLFERYRAMFALRNLGSEEAVLALGDGKGSRIKKKQLLDINEVKKSLPTMIQCFYKIFSFNK